MAPAAQRQPRGGPEAAQAQRSIAAQSPRAPGRQPVPGSHGDPPHHPHPRQRDDHHRRPELGLEGSVMVLRLRDRGQGGWRGGQEDWRTWGGGGEDRGGGGEGDLWMVE